MVIAGMLRGNHRVQHAQYSIRGRYMGNISRKAVLGVAAAITAATAASMTAGAAMAAPAAPATPAARVAPAAPATTCIVTRILSWPLTVQGNTGERVRTIQL